MTDRPEDPDLQTPTLMTYRTRPFDPRPQAMVIWFRTFGHNAAKQKEIDRIMSLYKAEFIKDFHGRLEGMLGEWLEFRLPTDEEKPFDPVEDALVRAVNAMKVVLAGQQETLDSVTPVEDGGTQETESPVVTQVDGGGPDTKEEHEEHGGWSAST